MQRSQQKHEKPHALEVKTVMTSTMILLGEQGTGSKQNRWCECWSYSSDEELSDEKNDQLWSEFDIDDDYDCSYQLLPLEEALRQFYKIKKAGPASGNHASLAAPEKRYKLMPIQEILMWNNAPAEQSSVFNVKTGESFVQRA